MAKIPHGLKGYRRDIIDFYGNHAAGSFQQLEEALRNRGYVISIESDDQSVREGLPPGLRSDLSYTVIRAVVTSTNPDFGNSDTRALHSLSSLSGAHSWTPFYHNSKTPIPKKDLRGKRR
ncbi:MAG: hypothetical protein COY38_00600 [Candidatus Aenigmarchaeota archaeon CG_4_10_14_0_8_um_filter_37_24]|nr:hypothetical protein [Candidatus Aenigmarchaeota archaeon]OIN88354.1 MAG: hypothetical protein AUJ50_01115 [Candidatus Aenigmarchaeota archaeon CG1_02_38_14]PIV68792.1 MAG: hypothetical protein COS07_02955 [Candidatus Aenigmarchaeota archaeon CG01_land_8_20_14_3_00_37_9]PIW41734.1 MAG: hypothetical protein COW21_00350 [Candidatus Aenigmarchaeota archaeon CG15_BIG_FIL_POST_REV_8_21_14_020_37_27]PIY35619.1 MAG: hypothetical protein COZ04_02930 [Candidatus Aenigmarchaeota archaeon CG_4_10_14_3_